MKIAIMQPYFLPYIGYFQLIHAADRFVIYDNIQYTKKGWINRNRILQNGKDEYISLPLKKDSDYLDVRERFLADTFAKDSQDVLRKIAGLYRKAPHFNEVYALLESIYRFDNPNLFEFIFNSVRETCGYLGINTEFVVSSTVPIDHQILKAEDKVLSLCKALEATVYINPIGGTELYQRAVFAEQQIDLQFLKANPLVYPQFNHEFVPWLSILDVMMFNTVETIRAHLDDGYTIVTN
ncbi:MAG: WbqC family protein [Saprospiraceae bacterium]